MDRAGTERTFNAECNWRTTHTLTVPAGMTKEEAVDAFNRGDFEKFEEFTTAGAELYDWQAS